LREQKLTEREQALVQRAQEVTRAQDELARELATIAARVAPASDNAPQSADGGRFNINVLERLVGENRAGRPDRAPEWDSYLFSLRSVAGIDGSLPRSVESIVEDVFGELLGARS
jgi:hypothetical protein